MLDEEELTIENLSTICRICLFQYDADNMSPIDEVHILSGEIKLMDVLLKYTTIENGEEYPPNICNLCIEKAEQSYCFFEKCNVSSNVFTQMKEKARLNNSFENYSVEEEEEIDSKFEIITIKNDDREDVEIKIIFDTENVGEEGEMEKFSIDDAVSSSHLFPLKKCKYCLIEMDNEEFEDHIMSFGHFAGSETLICPHCDSNLKNITTFRKHLRTHSTREVRKHVCNICGKIFNWSKNYLKHIMMHNNQEEKVMCPDCGLLLGNMTALQIHRGKEHMQTLAGEWQCQYCNHNFDQIADFKKHLKDVHATKDFHCIICAKDCEDKRTLYYHEQLHLDEFGIECEYCHKKLLTEEKLILHQRIHKYVKKKHVCHICSKGFKQLDKLEAHIRVHTGEKPFVCTYCSKAFNHQNNLTHHIRLHTGDTPYKCLFCAQEFSNSHSLRKHMNSHDGEKIDEYNST